MSWVGRISIESSGLVVRDLTIHVEPPAGDQELELQRRCHRARECRCQVETRLARGLAALGGVVQVQCSACSGLWMS